MLLVRRYCCSAKGNLASWGFIIMLVMLREERLLKTLLTVISLLIIMLMMMMMMIRMVMINTQLCSINYSHYGTIQG